MDDVGQLLGLGTEAIRLLIGDMGIQILTLVDQGCSDDADLIRFSALSRGCLEVKIPLLVTLGLMLATQNGYRITGDGEQVLDELLGWRP